MKTETRKAAIIRKLEVAAGSGMIDVLCETLQEVPGVDDASLHKNFIPFFVDKTLQSLLNEKKAKEAKAVLAAYMKLAAVIGPMTMSFKDPQTHFDIELQESFAAKAVVLYAWLKDPQIWAQVQQLIPETVSFEGLAFNLACVYAQKKDKAKMLEMAWTAVRLGKNRGDFLQDADFDYFKNDPDFLNCVQPAAGASKDTYYILEYDGFSEKEALGVSLTDAADQDLKFNQGRRVASPPRCIRFTMGAKERGELGDYVPGGSGLLVSARFRDVLEKADARNVQYIPAEIHDVAKKKIHSDYFIANVIGMVDCIDLTKTKLTMRVAPPGAIRSIEELYLDNTRMGGLQIFRLRRQITTVLVRESLQKQLAAAKLRGFGWKPAEGYSD